MAIWRTRSHARNIESRLAALKSDFGTLQRDVRDLSHGVGDAASDIVHSTGRATANALDSAGEWTNDSIGSLQDTVRRQPLAAVILSMSAGALVVALLSRR
jgi:succinyl-CoA synthetase beta subunit